MKNINRTDRRLADYDRIVFVDTETSGLRPKEDHIIELAAAAVEVRAGATQIVEEMNVLVRLPEGEVLPEVIEQLTNITSSMLEKEGISEGEAVRQFEALLGAGRILVVGYNAQFDLEILLNASRRQENGCERILLDADYLDPLTVYRDRYPDREHSLTAALSAYGLTDVLNSHRAMDDVRALMALTKALRAEKNDLESYINIFGYRAKYKFHGERLPGVEYIEQK